MHIAGKEEPMPTLTIGEGKNMVTQLLLVNLTVFVLLFFTQIIYNIEGNSTIRFNVDVLNQLVLPASLTRLLHAPWTVVTSLFVNESFWQIFSNMLWLWFFGYLLQRKAGHDRILPLYFYGGLSGIVLYLLGMQLIPSFRFYQFFASISGSAAPVMALAIGTLVVMPDYRLLPLLKGGGIPLWIITIVFIAISMGTHFLTHHDTTALPSLIGGGLLGYFYMRAWKNGQDWGAGLNKAVFNITHIFHPREHAHLKVVK